MTLLGITNLETNLAVPFLRSAWVRWTVWLACCGSALAPLETAAQTAQTNTIVANVTPSGFTLVWRGPVGAAPDVRLFADEAGTQSLDGQLGVEPYPVHTGYPRATNTFEKRLSKAWLRGKTTGYGLESVRVTGAKPSTTYYYQVVSSSATATNLTPQTPPLPFVRTAERNSLVPDSVQVLMDVQGLDVAGRIVTLTHSNSVSALASVVGDGAGTNQVWFNLAELIDLAGGSNFTPNGSLRFVAQVLGAGPDGGRALPVNVEFTDAFRVARSVLSQATSELVVVSLGSGVMQGGETSSVPVSLDATIPLGSLSLNLRIPPGHLTNLVLEAIAPEVDPTKLALTPSSGGFWSAKIVPRPGQALFAATELVRLKFAALGQVPSAFVPLQLSAASATKPDNSVANVALFRSGRMVVVVNEPLLEAHPGVDETRPVTLYGKPSFGYAIESAGNTQGPWTLQTKVAMTNLSRLLNLASIPQPLTFYRAYEIAAGAPELQITRRSSNQVDLLVFGAAGKNYTLQSARSLTPPLVWSDVLTFSLTNSVRTLEGIRTTNPASFLRLFTP
jgi:hypothetical protein